MALCSDPSTTVTAQVEAAGYSGVPEAFRQLATWITALFVFFTVTAFFADRRTDSEFALRLRAGQWRWLLLTAWIGFALNNLWKVAPEIGFDVNDHIDYVKYLLANHRIPLAVDGWQMFQSPLVYLISAPFYALFSSLAATTVRMKLMRIFSLVCGVAQVELCYRVSRIVYPEKNDLQIVATTVGSLIPMSLYMSSVFGNEPLAGALTSVLVLLCTWMLSTSPSEQTSRIAVLIGVFWGLAMLTKVTPLLLGPVIILAVMVHRLIMHPGSDRVFTTLRTIFLACFVTCGWYYGRNWIVLGTPFVGGWDPSRGIPWWQDPSYRTWSQVTSFGKCLQQPIYSGVVSFWDAIYSTMWSDGFLSGTIMQADRLPWNVSWMQAGAWLSLLPAACILLGLCRIGLFQSAATKACLLFAAASIGIYLAAVFDLYLQIPIFSAAKSSYMLGLLPCFGILAASGASAVLNFRWLRPIFFGWLGCWSVASYAAYFCIR